MTPNLSQQEILLYIRAKVNQLLMVMGTSPLRVDELDDDTLIEFDPIGIIAESFQQVINNYNETNQHLSLALDEIRAILDALGAALMVINSHDRIESCNHLALKWLFADSDKTEIVGKLVNEVCVHCSETLMNYRNNPDSNYHITNLFGRDIQLIASKICDGVGNHAKTVMLFTDISHRVQAEEALRIAATAFEVQEGMVITDTEKVILRVNRAFSEITGYSAEEIVGKTPSLLASGRHDKTFYVEMWKSIERTGKWQGEIWNRCKNSEVYPEWLMVNAVKNGAGLTTHYVGTFTDVTSRKKAEEEIMNLAFFDPLTGLPNRRLLLDRLKQAIASSTRSTRHGALLFLDLDNFKTLNDTRGHDIGDLLLQQVASRLVTCVREGDTVARIGGDEFVVMLEDLSENMLEAANQTEIVGEKILVTLNQVYHLANCAHHNTPSIGVTLFVEHQGSIDDLMKRADLAMYQAKAAGRNTLRFFDPEMQAVVTTRAAMEADLREAILKKQFLLYYQAQVDSEGYLTGVEALLRWRHPQRGLVSPLDFIPLSEETGLIIPLGHWVLETACLQLSTWAALPHMAHLTVAVNVSARQIHHPNFVDTVLTILDDTGANPERLKLELTESLLVDNVEEVIGKMTVLKEKGVSFSLDDFGTGYSSLSYLKRLPLDQLKIDRSFIKDILTDTNDSAIAKMIVALGESMGLSVIAEGVEIEAQKNFLSNHGCNAYQGFLYSHPLPIEEFEDVVTLLNVSMIRPY
jgi:diguanylate cyclase (GGDEF)-like protein/PAS domain S-box-containing protein